LILIGIPGSGKSTWLNSLEKVNCDGGFYLRLLNDLYTIICPDEIRRKLGSVSDQSQNLYVWQEAKDRTIGCLEHGTNVILDATNVNTANRRDFISGIPALPPCIKLAKIFPTDPEIAWERIRLALKNGIDRSNVPEETIYRMYGEYLYTSKVISSEGFTVI
jgi:predicted kinase